MNAKTKRRTLIVVAMLVLLTTVLALSGMTFAKYISTTSAQTQTATVAKWGFVVSADATNLFGSRYAGKANNLAVIPGENNTLAINVAADDKVVAPGTTGSMTFSISGQAEVRSKLTISLNNDIEDVCLSKTTVEGENVTTQKYNPIEWTLTKAGENDPIFTGTLEGLNTYFNDTTNSTEVIEANADHFTLEGTYTLTWAWVFDGGDGENSSGITGLSGNEADTLLGQFAEGTVETPDDYDANTELSFGLSITIEQIQEDTEAVNQEG